MPVLFRQPPDLELVERFLQRTVGLRNLHDSSWFTKQSVRIQEAELLLPELEPFYIPCKAEEYLHNALTPSRCLTILRQLVRPHGSDLCAKERSTGGKKALWYCLVAVASSVEIGPAQEISVTFD